MLKLIVSFLLVIFITDCESLISSLSRISGKPYEQLNWILQNECFRTCIYDKRCVVSTYEMFEKACYLFNTANELVQDERSNSFFKNAIIPSTMANNTRLFNHYNRFNSQSQPECVQKCQNDVRCIATTFQVSSRQCYLYDSYKQKQENGWISSFNPSLPLIKINDPRFINNTRLFNHYKEFQSISQLECAQRCLTDGKCSATTFDSTHQNCYFYDKYENTAENGWASFFRTGNPFVPSRIGFNTRFFEYYDVKIVETQSDCFALCDQQNKCICVSYRLSTKQCYLHDSLGEESKEPGWMIYIKLLPFNF